MHIFGDLHYSKYIKARLQAGGRAEKGGRDALRSAFFRLLRAKVS